MLFILILWQIFLFLIIWQPGVRRIRFFQKLLSCYMKGLPGCYRPRMPRQLLPYLKRTLLSSGCFALVWRKVSGLSPYPAESVTYSAERQIRAPVNHRKGISSAIDDLIRSCNLLIRLITTYPFTVFILHRESSRKAFGF